MTERRLKIKDDYLIPKQVPSDIPHGDMPRDIVVITEKHIEKTSAIFPQLVGRLAEKGLLTRKDKIVISVFGGAGAGKSEVASVLSYYFACNGWNCYVLSGDNYNRRVPVSNFPERTRIFRSGGVHGLLLNKLYNPDVKNTLDKMWTGQDDFNVDLVEQYPFLKIYQEYGRAALTEYLGSVMEMEYEIMNPIIKEFKEGRDHIMLKRMNNGPDEIWYEEVDFYNIDIMFIEWVHASHQLLEGIDLWIMLDGTPQDTVAHRAMRKREKEIQGPWISVVLDIEDRQMRMGAKKAAIIVTKEGEIIDYPQYQKMRFAFGYNE